MNMNSHTRDLKRIDLKLAGTYLAGKGQILTIEGISPVKPTADSHWAYFTITYSVHDEFAFDAAYGFSKLYDGEYECLKHTALFSLLRHFFDASDSKIGFSCDGVRDVLIGKKVLARAKSSTIWGDTITHIIVEDIIE